MTSRTAQRREAGPPPEVEAPPTWASADALGTEDAWEDTDLLVLGMRVRVRYLETPEVLRLQFLPDYADYLSLAVEMSKGKTPEELNVDNMGSLAEKTAKYQAFVAHLSVMDPDADPAPVECAACSMTHPPSLWGVHQAARLKPPDLDLITGVALRINEVMPVIPFSEENTDSATPSPPSSGE